MPKTRLDDSIERFPTQARFTPLSCPHCLWSQEGYRARRGGEHLQQGGGPGGGKLWEGQIESWSLLFFSCCS